jgi:glycosyltransferase involved in cell wall biosynthesis
MISIITPCLNRVDFISQAVESVLAQNRGNAGGVDFEHIIIDGGSTDGTLERLAGYPHLRLVSEPDQGIYDALNKGVKLAQGELIGFLNTDDLYAPGIFRSVFQAFENDSTAEAVVGGASIFILDPAGLMQTLSEFPCVLPQTLFWRATQGVPVFNAWFFRKRMIEALGGFDLQYKLVSDRDFLVRMAFQNQPYCCLDRVVYQYRMHPGSHTLSGEDSGEAPYMFEMRRLAENYLRRKDLDRHTLSSFRAWHSQISVEQIRSAVHQHAYDRAMGYACSGLRHNMGWPVVFARKLVERIPYILAGGEPAAGGKP